MSVDGLVDAVRQLLDLCSHACLGDIEEACTISRNRSIPWRATTSGTRAGDLERRELGQQIALLLLGEPDVAQE